MAMEIVQTINGAHEDALAGVAYNPINRHIYTCAEGDKAIKVRSKCADAVPACPLAAVGMLPPQDLGTN
jgi:hypothetical protein